MGLLLQHAVSRCACCQVSSKYYRFLSCSVLIPEEQLQAPHVVSASGSKHCLFCDAVSRYRYSKIRNFVKIVVIRAFLVEQKYDERMQNHRSVVKLKMALCESCLGTCEHTYAFSSAHVFV